MAQKKNKNVTPNVPADLAQYFVNAKDAHGLLLCELTPELADAIIEKYKITPAKYGRNHALSLADDINRGNFHDCSDISNPIRPLILPASGDLLDTYTVDLVVAVSIVRETVLMVWQVNVIMPEFDDGPRKRMLSSRLKAQGVKYSARIATLAYSAARLELNGYAFSKVFRKSDKGHCSMADAGELALARADEFSAYVKNSNKMADYLYNPKMGLTAFDAFQYIANLIGIDDKMPQFLAAFTSSNDGKNRKVKACKQSINDLIAEDMAQHRQADKMGLLGILFKCYLSYRNGTKLGKPEDNADVLEQIEKAIATL